MLYQLLRQKEGTCGNYHWIKLWTYEHESTVLIKSDSIFWINKKSCYSLSFALWSWPSESKCKGKWRFSNNSIDVLARPTSYQSHLYIIISFSRVTYLFIPVCCSWRRKTIESADCNMSSCRVRRVCWWAIAGVNARIGLARREEASRSWL
jgi:hypothetical protein